MRQVGEYLVVYDYGWNGYGFGGPFATKEAAKQQVALDLAYNTPVSAIVLIVEGMEEIICASN